MDEKTDQELHNSLLVEQALLDKALGGDLRAQMYWLNNRRADRWSASPEKNPPKSEPVTVVVDL